MEYLSSEGGEGERVSTTPFCLTLEA
jgi:hypothetical protein